MTTGDRVIVTVDYIRGLEGTIVSGPSEQQLFRVRVDGKGHYLLLGCEIKLKETV